MKSTSLRSGQPLAEKTTPSSPTSHSDIERPTDDRPFVDDDFEDETEMDPEQMKGGVWRVGMQPAPPRIPTHLGIDEDLLKWYQLKGNGFEYVVNHALRMYYNTYK